MMFKPSLGSKCAVWGCKGWCSASLRRSDPPRTSSSPGTQNSGLVPQVLLGAAARVCLGGGGPRLQAGGQLLFGAVSGHQVRLVYRLSLPRLPVLTELCGAQSCLSLPSSPSSSALPWAHAPPAPDCRMARPWPFPFQRRDV